MKSIGIAGLGLIGGSIGARLRQAGFRVRGFDARAEHGATALSRSLVDQLASSLEDVVRDVDVVILATPLNAILRTLPVIDALAMEDALVVDTGAVKRPVVECMANLRTAARAIGGHPLAGKESSGPAAADPNLFEGKPFLLTPSSRTAEETVSKAKKLVEVLGAKPVVMEAAAHDEVVARTSHLPQFLSIALSLCLRSDEVEAAGPGLRDMTRLSMSDIEMWSDIAPANRDNILSALSDLSLRIEQIREAIEEENRGQIEERMARAREIASAVQKAVPA